MDMGVIKSFKGCFRRFLLLQLIDRRERGLDDKVSILDAIYLMKDVWDTVTPAVVSNCFRRAGLLSDVYVNNESVAEGEPAFSEWLKQSEIKTFEHVLDIEDFVNADDDLATSAEPTDNDIIDAVLQKEDSD
jgi:hypothetical protein